jgi:HlyD family secretion protein
MRRKLSILLVILFLGGIGTGVYIAYWKQKPPLRFLTARVERGRIAATINATGTVNAVVTVQVGSQVTGRIQQLFADFNTAVQAGQVIAQIDSAPFEARVSQARANVASTRAAVQVSQATVENTKAAIETAQANTESAQANVEKARVTLADARRTRERQQGLVSRSVGAQSALDTAQTASDEAVSQLKLAEAQYAAALGQLKSAKAQTRLAEAQYSAALAQVEQAKAVLQAAELDLDHTTIRSPVNGTVVARNVDMGQTVAASLQAPTLFLIAQDLTRMQVDTNVSEADIGRVQEGQRATFTVDAYPEAPFPGKVVQVRNAPITVQNVVTYNAVVEVANPELKLKPGMTANVTFITDERDQVLKIPLAALRFQPGGVGQDTAPQRGGREPTSGDRLQAMRERLTQTLSLTHEQQAHLDTIFQRVREQRRRLREQELSAEEQRTRRREAQTQTRSQIRSILTDTQRQQYNDWLKTVDAQRAAPTATGRQGQAWVLQADGILARVPLRLGIADDSFTEVVDGDLRAGQDVVIGVAMTAQRVSSTPPGFGRRPF